MNPRRTPLLWSLLALLATQAQAQSPTIEINTPSGGWRSGSGEGADYTQPILYPASSVNTPEGQADTARIRGRIAAAAPKNPALLVVNGVAMPLKIAEDGSFDRPYLFNGGSNSVEVRDADREVAHRVQFHSAGKGETPARLRVLLAWDSDNTDLDLHVVTPDGGHAWYGSQVLPNGAALDVDVTTGYGPEIFSTPTPMTGSYLVYINYYGGGYDAEAGDVAQALTTASITVISREGTPDERQETVLVPMRAAGELTLVKQFSYP